MASEIAKESDNQMAADMAAVREASAALNRGDVAGYVRILDPAAEWVEPYGFPGGGTTCGRPAVQAHLEFHRGRWAEGSCTSEQIAVVGRRIVQVLAVRVRLKGETAWREGRVAEVYTFRGGKAVQVRIFGDVQEGMAWAAT